MSGWASHIEPLRGTPDKNTIVQPCAAGCQCIPAGAIVCNRLTGYFPTTALEKADGCLADCPWVA